MNSERLPPQSKDAERGVLGSILRDNSILPEVLELVGAESFYFDAHQKIFKAIAEVHNEGKPVDLVILADRLKSKNWIEDVGGYVGLYDLWDIAPTAANGVHHAGIVHEKAGRRQLIHLANQLLKDAEDQSGSFDDLLSETQRSILSLGNDQKAGEIQMLRDHLVKAQLEFERRSKNKNLAGVPSGLVELDMLTGGFLPGELVVLAARPSVGKTAMAVDICRHAAREGFRPLMFSLEQEGTEIASRLLCGEAEVSSHTVRLGRLSSDDATRITVASAKLSKLPIWINDTPYQKTRKIISTSRRLSAKEKIGLVVVDYLQLIGPEDERASTNDQIARNSRDLKLLARELKLPIIVLSQLNRESEKRKNAKPQLSDLRGSGSIEQDADTVIFLHRPGEQDPSDRLELIEAIVAKQRNGPTGEVSLHYRKRAMRFENYSPDIS